jgi:hypothetical protein
MGKALDVQKGKIHRTKLYGDIEVLEYIDTKNVVYKFLTTGHIGTTTSNCVRAGKVKDPMSKVHFNGVACIGSGEYGANNSAYAVWKFLIDRCYPVKSREAKHIAYKNTSICEDWLNFQNFAKWYNNTHPCDGGEYQLDKDLLQKNLKYKVYSKDTCVFITRNQNMQLAHAKEYTFLNPDGEKQTMVNLSEFCKLNNLDRSSMFKLLNGKRKTHKGWKNV